MTRLVLGISAYYHDAAAALITDGRIVAAAQEERFSRRKHDPRFPAGAARYCLEAAGAAPGDLAAVVFYDKPFLKFERILETHAIHAPAGFRAFAAALPEWLGGKAGLRGTLRAEWAKIDPEGAARVPILFSEHHLSHAASAYYPSPFDEAAVLTVDGAGEWACAAIGRGRDAALELLAEQKFPHSLGLFYSAVTGYLGFRVNSGEYKVMGLSPYGDPASERTARYEKLLGEHFLTILPDGSVRLALALFDFPAGTRMANEPAWERLLGFPPRRPESEILPEHADFALAAQRLTERALLAMAAEAKRLTGSENLCLAGGVALNCVANRRLLDAGLFRRIWIQPAAGDAGGALGAALAAHHLHFKEERRVGSPDAMRGALLGPEFSDREIEASARRFGAVLERAGSTKELLDRAARRIAGGAVAGWFQGRMEWGPRALGNRSILADPRDPSMWKRLNLKIKFRESFRPFAPAVPLESAREWFDLPEGVESPYMLLVAPVAEARRNPPPAEFLDRPVRGRVGAALSAIPAVTHLDFSARLQTVREADNPLFHGLLSAFERLTGCPVLVNTSFNVRGEPIVCTPDDAYRCFMRTDMDLLVMGPYLFEKSAQPPWPEGREWREDLVLD